MLIHIVKSTFIAIALSLIFCPMQIFAAEEEKTLETLHSRPKQTDPLQLEKSQGIIFKQSETHVIEDPILLEPLTPLIDDSTINIPTAPEVVVPEVTIPEPVIPEVTIPEVTIPKPEQDKELDKDNALTNMQNTPQNQDQELLDAVKDKPSQSIVPLSLTDFLIQTTKDDQKELNEKTKEIKPAEKAPAQEEKAPTQKEKDLQKDIPAKEKIIPKEDAPTKEKANKLEKKKGEPLKIPKEAKQTGNLDFLEGCWVGYRPEYITKRMITERFCFDDKGIGKRYIIDPAYAGECVGSSKAIVNKDGLLHLNSEIMYCSPSGEQWGASEMQCQGEGKQTPCKWIFANINGATQSYTINFVRE